MESRFDEIIDRHHTMCEKYDGIARSGRPEDTIPLWVADMDFRAPDSVREALHRLADHGIFGYSFTVDEYFEAVRNWFATRFGWEPKQEWLVCTPGVVYGFSAAIQALTQEGDAVLIQQPVYPPFAGSLENTGRRLVNSPLHEENGRYCMESPDEIERRIVENNVKIFLLCSPHNPCGRVWKREELEKISQLCRKYNVLVVDDEIHHDLIMPGYEHTVYASISEEAEQNCLVLTAPSKTFNLAGLQTSNIFVPNEELRSQYVDYLRRGTGNPKCNILGYKACEIAYSSCGEWLDQCISVVNRNKDLIVNFLAENFPQIQVCELQATYLLWMDWNGLGLDYKELERINRQEAYLFFDEGYVFGKQGEGFERWNLACPTRYIERALERMKNVYSKYVK